MSKLLSPEQLAELDLADANAAKEALLADTPAEETPTEPVNEETPVESATEETVEAKTKEVTYREEIVEEDDTSEPEDTSEETVEPIKFSDDDLVVDPLTGDQVTGRELRNRMLMQSDYTRKTQELADMRKDLESRMESLEAKATKEVEKSDEPQFDPDDPYAQADAKTREDLKATQNALLETQEQLYQLRESIEYNENRQAVETFEKIKTDVLDRHKDVITENDLEAIGDQFMVRAKNDPNITYGDVADAYAGRIKSAQEKALADWKTRNRVDATTKATESKSPGPSTTPKFKLGDKSIIEAMDKDDLEFARRAAQGG